MTQIERIEQLSCILSEIDCNGLRVENALIHLELGYEDFEMLEDEWKNRIDAKFTSSWALGLRFNGIDFSITKKRY